MRRNVIALNFIRRYHPITVLLIFENVFYLGKNVLSCVIFHLELLYLYDFLAYKYQLKYCTLFLFIHAIWSVWRDVGCWECGMLEKWHIEYVGWWRCEILGMWDVKNLGCWRCGMLGMWDVKELGCWGYGMFGMWNVPDVGCLCFGMFLIWVFGLWDVWDVRCWGCGVYGMWNVGDVGC